MACGGCGHKYTRPVRSSVSPKPLAVKRPSRVWKARPAPLQVVSSQVVIPQVTTSDTVDIGNSNVVEVVDPDSVFTSDDSKGA